MIELPFSVDETLAALIALPYAEVIDCSIDVRLRGVLFRVGRCPNPATPGKQWTAWVSVTEGTICDTGDTALDAILGCVKFMQKYQADQQEALSAKALLSGTGVV